ncbi:hypothetical protein ANCDUO_02399 [Ancylostoma duodenale]|uniref:Uncharacterized protein n=1 Tax=Ancylostoma duodenale TaxID=51022 RepID=A0A0C2H0I4_9BILA|nr:hypothetical protein ANCDUO_02399 [Ancylostoma duodenale]
MQKKDTVVPDVCEAIGEDLQVLLKAFEMKRSLRFREFLEVAVEFELHNVYIGRLNVAEYLEFAENFLKSAFIYASPGNPSAPRNIVERVFGIYSTYYLYCAQVTDYHVKCSLVGQPYTDQAVRLHKVWMRSEHHDFAIHTTVADIRGLLDFIKDELLPKRHLDAVGCVYKLVCDDAFTVAAFQKDFDPVCHRRWDSTEDRDGKDPEDKTYVPLQEADATMMRVQKEIKKRVAFTPNMTVSNIVEQGDDFIQRIQKHLAELHRRIKEVDHPHNIAQDEHEVVVKSEAYGENEALSRISLREKAYYSPISVGMGRNSAHWVEES